MTKPSTAELADLRDLFSHLRRIMIREADRRWLEGVEEMLRLLTPPISEEDWQNLVSTYRSMYRGPGSFGDFFLWRDTVEERIEANRELDAITAAIWRYFAS